MEIENKLPPNYSEIIKYLSPNKEATFCYGDKVYNPSKKELQPDIIRHEEVHQAQQKKYTSPDIWWQKYLTDKDFRLSQEIEAYGEQYKYAKERGVTGKLLEWVKDKMAMALSGDEYGNMISYGQAVSKIRNYDKK